MKTSRILQYFCYGYFDDLLTTITFAINFEFLAGVVSKILAIENALQLKNQCLCNAFGKKLFVASRYHDNLCTKT